MAKESVSEELLQQLFMDRMPTNVKPLLVFGGEKLDKLAEMADKVIDTISGQSVMAIRNSSLDRNTNRTTARDHINQLEQAYKLRLDNICTRLERVEASLRKNNNNPHRARSRTRSVGNRDQSVERKPCYYHRPFGAQAKRCLLPCSFNQNLGN